MKNNVTKKQTAETNSVDFDGSVDLPYEHVRCVKTDGPCKEPEGQDHESRVAKVQQRRNKLHDVQLEERNTTSTCC